MQKGFTLFFAMLVAALSLSVGLAIYDLTAREIDLSSTATQSQYALYAADTGAECALYWDTKYVYNANYTGSAFGTSTPPGSIWAPTSVFCSGTSGGASLDVTTLPPPSQDLSRYPECTGNSGSAWCVSSTATAATTTFSLTYATLPYCAVVEVAKRTVGNVLFTTITSRGYNTCASGAPVRVERALQINY